MECNKIIKSFWKQNGWVLVQHPQESPLSPVVAKVFERIIYDQLYVYLTKNNLLSKHQSGFRAVHSTVTVLLKATDSWALNIDHGLINAVVFLDLKKAFDSVDHEILLFKLRSYGIRRLALRLFRSYLEDLTQTYQIDCSKSTPKFLKCGVPRGCASRHDSRPAFILNLY